MSTSFRSRHLRDEEGAIAVLTAIVMVVLVVFAAIVVDLGNARDVRRQSQNASDASSLAAANMLYPDGLLPSQKLCQNPLGGAPPCIKDAVAAAKSYALSNFLVTTSDWTTSCPQTAATLPLGSVYTDTPCISFDSATPTLVRVYMPTRTAPTFFGRIAGFSSILVGSSAHALVTTSVKCTLCFLGNVDAGNGDYSVTGGSIAVSGSVTAHSNSIWTSASNGVSGAVSGGVFTPPVTTIPPFADPLASLALPLDLTGLGLTTKTDPCGSGATHGPGLYGDVAIPNSTCTLQPGLYVISGTWGMKNKTVLQDLGAGVTLYVKKPGALDFKNGDAIITASSTGVGKGYAIIYDRDNTNTLGLQGNGNTLITGSVYAPASILDGNGNSCYGFSGGPFVFGGGYSNGNPGCVMITNAKDTTVSQTPLHLIR